MQALPNFIRAKTPSALKQLCADNSIKKDRYFKYQIVFDGSFWFAWYEEDATDSLQAEIKAREIIDGANDK